MNPLELAEMEAELQRDLEALSRVRRIMEARGNGSGANKAPMSSVVAPLPVTTMPIDTEEDEDGESPGMSLRGKIAEVINADPDVKWTTQKMLLHLQKTGFRLKAVKPRFSVGQALNKLTEQGKIKLTRRGTGSEPNIYRGLASTQTIAKDTLFFEGGNAQKEGGSKLN